MFLIKPFFVALMFSSFIYLEYFFGLNSFLEFLNTVFAIVAIGYILTLKPKQLFIAGFFIGVFWFYWISFSFRYYDLTYLAPFVVLVIGAVYGGLFLILSLFQNYIARAFIFIFLFTLIEPFGFNWFKPELLFVNSFFDNHLQFYVISFLIALALSLEKLNTQLKLAKYLYITAITTLLVALFYVDFKFSNSAVAKSNLNIYLADTNLSQDRKWDREYLNEIVQSNLDIIDSAIDQNYDLVVLPESAFPVFLSEEPMIVDILKDKSKNIAIYTGALRLEDNSFYNSAFLFHKNSIEIADKVELVPFGEEIPFPSFIGKFFNSIFFDGAMDYVTSKKPFDFNISGEIFRNAICFEATVDSMYEDSPDFFMVISNNAWFTPSTEPTLQRIFLRFYAKKYNKTIYHSNNMSRSEVIFGD